MISYPVKLIGIDPGKSGAVILLIIESDSLEVSHVKGKETDHDIKNFIKNSNPDYAYLELITALPQKGKQEGIGRGSIATSKISDSYGFYRGLLTALDIPYDTVTPSVWQRNMKCLTGGDKRITRARAQQLYSKFGVKVTHAIADALLIATYGKKMYFRDLGLNLD